MEELCVSLSILPICPGLTFSRSGWLTCRLLQLRLSDPMSGLFACLVISYSYAKCKGFYENMAPSLRSSGCCSSGSVTPCPGFSPAQLYHMHSVKDFMKIWRHLCVHQWLLQLLLSEHIPTTQAVSLPGNIKAQNVTDRHFFEKKEPLAVQWLRPFSHNPKVVGYLKC